MLFELFWAQVASAHRVLHLLGAHLLLCGPLQVGLGNRTLRYTWVRRPGIFSRVTLEAIFLVGATNRPDQVDAAILSRFAERIEIPLPDAPTRAALLELFLSPLPFGGDKTSLIGQLVLIRSERATGTFAPSLIKPSWRPSNGAVRR